jgi:hypothetical protein
VRPVPEDIFTKRGISEEIKDARPYTPWETDNLDPVREAYGSLGESSLNFALGIARQSPGHLIKRYPPEGLGLDDIYPEFRPKDAVKTKGPIWDVHVHTHTQGVTLDSEAEELVAPYVRNYAFDKDGYPMPPPFLPWYVRTLSGRALENHVMHGYNPVVTEDGFFEMERVPKSPTDHPYPPDQEWMVRRDWHKHQGFAKYVFPTTPKVDETWTHDHHATWHDHEGWSDKRIAAHVAEKHESSEQAWYGQRHPHPHTYDVILSRSAEKDWHAKAAHIINKRYHDGVDRDGEHPHPKRVKDKTMNLARRLDVHPWAMEKIRAAEVIFFVLEGCLKADSVLAKGAAVFSVPSVSLWDCKELKDFTKTYLQDKGIVVVCDADWAQKEQVIAQARLCHATLGQFGVGTVHIAAPPIGGDRKPLVENGKELKGVDDFLGAGHGLGELQTVDYYLSPATLEAIDRLVEERYRQAGQAAYNSAVLKSMALFAGPKGLLPSSMGMTARAMGPDFERRRVTEAIKQLKAWGAVTYDGELIERRNYWSDRLDWQDVEPIIIAEQYRAEAIEPRPLDEAICKSLTNFRKGGH